MNSEPAPTMAAPDGAAGTGVPERVVATLDVRGLTCVVATSAQRAAPMWDLLAQTGISARLESSRGIVFAVQELHLLVRLHDVLQLQVNPEVAGLVRVVRAASDSQDPVTLDVGVAGLVASVHDGARFHDITIADSVIAALLHARVPVAASPGAWEYMHRVAALPMALGHARLAGGAVRIDALKPQFIESAPIPGLYRLGEQTFGAPDTQADAVAQLHGIDWAGPQQAPARPVGLEDAFRDSRGWIIETGMHNRVSAVVLAAAQHVQACESLVIVSPHVRHGVWRLRATQRGLTCRLQREADVVLTTPDALGGLPADAMRNVSHIVFDVCAADRDALARGQARDAVPLPPDVPAGLAHATRIAIVRQRPDTTQWLARLGAHVRPNEFDAHDESCARYVEGPAGLAAHIATVSIALGDQPLPNEVEMETIAVDITREQHDAITRVSHAAPDAVERVHAIVDAGTGDTLSPKVLAAVRAARSWAAKGHRVHVAIHPAAYPGMGTLLESQGVALAEAGQQLQQGEVACSPRGGNGPDNADVLVVATWMGGSDIMLGREEGPRVIVSVHAPDTIDDRLVLSGALAADGVELVDSALRRAWLLGSATLLDVMDAQGTDGSDYSPLDPNAVRSRAAVDVDERRQLLVLDDPAPLILSVGRTGTPRGYVVRAAAHVEADLAHVRASRLADALWEHQPDVVIVDLGAAAQRAVASLREWYGPHMTVVCVGSTGAESASVQPDDLVDAISVVLGEVRDVAGQETHV